MFIVSAIGAGLLAGCSMFESDADPGARSAADEHQPGSSDQAGAPVAYLDGEAVRVADLRATLFESAGGQALSELLIDRAVARRMADRRLKVTDADLDAERDRLAATLHADRDQAQRFINELRERRGLGPERFDRLLRRNAALRLLVQEEIVITDAALRQAYDIRHGPRRQVRIIVTNTVTDAQRLARQAAEGASFIDLAIAHSIDGSRAQGGLLDPISPADPTWPKGLREAITTLEPGQVSNPIALDRGFAIVQLQRVLPGSDAAFEQVLPELERMVRLDMEGQAIRRLIRTMVDEADLLILDPALDWSWRNQQRDLEAGPR